MSTLLLHCEGATGVIQLHLTHPHPHTHPPYALTADRKRRERIIAAETGETCVCRRPVVIVCLKHTPRDAPFLLLARYAPPPQLLAVVAPLPPYRGSEDEASAALRCGINLVSILDRQMFSSSWSMPLFTFLLGMLVMRLFWRPSLGEPPHAPHASLLPQSM